MKRTISRFFLFWFSFCLVVEYDASELNVCSSIKCSATEKFRVDQITSITYDYNLQVNTDIQGINNDKAENLSLTARVNLQLVSPCEFILQMQSVKASGVQLENDLAASLEQNPIKFHINGNGVVEAVCPFHDRQEIVNIKKGIISLLQSSAIEEKRKQRINDIDVLGECPTDYTQRRGWTSWIINREKDLSLCKHHQHLQSSIRPNHLTKNLRSLPLIRGHQTCHQVVGSGFVIDVICKEEHVFRPFSTQDGGGAATKITQKLSLVKQDFKNHDVLQYSQNIHDRSTLVALHSLNSNTANEHSSIHQICSDLCKETEHGVTIRTLSLFEALSHVLQSKSESDLLNVIAISESHCSRSKKITLDAIGQLNSAASTSVMVKLLLDGTLPQSTKNSWVNSLSFQENVTIDKIEAILPLFNFSSSNSAYLAASVMVSIYCRDHSSCKENKVIYAIGIHLEEQISRSCQQLNSDNGHQVLLALKAIGNIGILDQLIPKLTNCLNNDYLPLHLRLAAVMAHRRFSCQIPRSHLLQLYLNQTMSSELRIAAYLEVMRCPTPTIIQIIENALEDEEINQVGSFIWTHLTNIQKSADLCKSYLQSLLANVRLQKKFSTDVRKFSRAFESSVFSEVFDTGLHSEAHVIFPTDSYIPRSLLLNFTVDIFGRSVNLLEVSGRAEGFEPLIQSIFGPGDFVSTYTQWKEKFSLDENKLDDIKKRQLQTSTFGQEPNAVASLKFFGNEVHLWSARGKELLSSFGHKWDLQHFLTGLTNDQHMEFSQISNLIDSRLIVSTGSGLPLTLSLKSTAALNLNLGGKIDIRRLFASRSCHIDGHVRPSVSIAMTGSMSVDLLDNVAGVQLDTTLHSSTFLDGRLEMHAGELVRLRLNIPRDKLEVLNVQSKLLVVQGQKTKNIMGIQQDREDYRYCSAKLTSKPIGIQICGQLAYPNASRALSAPYFPLTGPAKIQLFLEKTDPALTTYLIEYRWEKDKMVHSSNRDTLHHFLMSFNTPRSSIDRELTVELLMNRADREISFRLLSPYKKIIFSGNYIYEVEHKKLDAILVVDNEKFLVQTDLRSESTKTTYRFLPTLHIRSPTQPLLSMSGSLIFLIGTKLSIDVRLDHLIPHPIIFSGHVTKSDRHSNRLDWNLQLDARPLFTEITGFYQTDEDGLSATCTFGYSWSDGEKEYIEFLTKVRKMSLPNGRLTRVGSTTELRLTAFPEYNTLVTWNFLNAYGHVENIVQFGFGVNSRDEYHQISLQQIFSYSGTMVDSNIACVLKIVYPVKEVDFGVVLNYTSHNEIAITQLVIQMKPDQQIKLLVNLTDQTKSLAKVFGQVVLELPSRTIRMRGSLIEETRHYYLLASTISWDVDKQMTVVANYHNKSHRKQLFYILQANVTVLDGTPWQWNYAFLARENLMHLSTQCILSEDVQYSFLANLTRPERGNYNFYGLVVWVDTDYSLDSTLVLGDEKLLKTDLHLGPERLIRSLLASKMYDDLTTVDFELLWDAKRNVSQKIGLGIEFRRLKLGQSRSFMQLQYPGTNIKARLAKKEIGSYFFPGPFVYTIKGEIDWNDVRQIAINIDANRAMNGYRQEEKFLVALATTLIGFEKVEGEMYRVQDGVEWQGVVKGILSNWFQGQAMLKVTDILSSQRTDVTLNWITRFDKVEEVNFRCWWLKSATQVKGQLMSTWSGDKKLVVYLEVNDASQDFTRIFGTLNISTPWPEFQLLMVGFNYVLSGAILDVRGKCQWNSNSILAVHLTSKNNQNGEYHTVVLVNTPIANFEELLLQSYLQMRSNEFATNATIKWQEQQKVFVEFYAGRQMTSRRKMVEAGVKLITPFEILNSIGAKFKYFKDRQSVNFFNIVQWPKDNVVHLNVDLLKNNQLGFKGNLSLTTPWRGYRIIGGLLQHKRTSNYLNSTINLIKDTKIIKGHVFSNSNRHQVQRDFVVETPFEFLKQLVIFGNSEAQDKTVTRRGQFRYNFGQSEGDYILKTNEVYSWQGTANLKTKTRQIQLDSVQNYKVGHLRHVSILNLAGNNIINLDVKLLNEFPVNKTFEGSFKLLTPFKNLENIQAQLLYSIKAENTSLHISGFVLARNVFLTAWKGNKNNKDLLQVTFSTGENLYFFINNSCGDFEEISCNGSGVAKWNENNLDFNGNVDFNKKNSSIKLKLLSSFEFIKEVDVFGSYDKLEKNFRLLYNRNKDEDFNLNATWLNYLSCNSALRRPDGLWSVSGLLDIASKKRFTINLLWPQDKEIYCHLHHQREDLFNASVKFSNIFRLTPLAGEVAYKKEEFITQIKTFGQWSEEQLLQFNSGYNNKNGNFLLEVRTEMGDQQRYRNKFQFTHIQDGQYSCAIELNSNDQFVQANASMTNRPKFIDVNLDASSSVENFKDIKFRLLQDESKRQTWLVITDDNILTFNGTALFNFDSDGLMTIQLTVDTIFHLLTIFRKDGHQASVDFQLGGRLHVFSGKLFNDQNKFSGSLQEVSSGTDFHQLRISLIPFDGNGQELQLATDNQQHRVTFHFQHENNDGNAFLFMSSPLLPSGQISSNATFQTNGGKTVGIFTLNLPEKDETKISINLIFNRPTDWAITLTGQGPFFPSNFNTFIHYINIGRLTDLQVEFRTDIPSISHLGMEMRLDTIPGQKIDARFKLYTPFVNSDVISIEGTIFHDKDFNNIHPFFIFLLPVAKFNISGGIQFQVYQVISQLDIATSSGRKLQMASVFVHGEDDAEVGLTLRSPWIGYEKIQFNGSYKLGDENRCQLELSLPEETWKGEGVGNWKEFPYKFDVSGKIYNPVTKKNFVLEVHQNLTLDEVDSKFLLVWPEDKVIELGLQFVLKSTVKSGNLIAKTPLISFRQVEASYFYSNQKDLLDTRALLISNYDCNVDFHLFTNTTESESQKIIKLVNPMWPFQLSFNTSYSEKEIYQILADFTKNPQKNPSAPFNVQLSFIKRPTGREIVIKTITQKVLTIFNSSYDKTNVTSNYQTHFSWNSEEHEKILGYSLTILDKSHSDRNNYDISLTLSHPIRSVKFKGEVIRGKKFAKIFSNFHWDLTRHPEKVLGFRLEGSNRQASVYEGEIGLVYPNLQKEFVLKGNLTGAKGRSTIMSCHFIADYSHNPRDLVVGFLRVTNGSGQDYVYIAEAGVKQLSSEINVHLIAEGRQFNETTEASCRVSYRKQFGEEFVRQVKGGLDKSERNVFLELTNEEDVWKLRGKVDDDENNRLVSFEYFRNEEKIDLLQLLVDKNSGKVDFKVKYLNQSYYKIKGGLQSNTEVVFKSFRDEEDNHDVSMSLELITPFLVTYRFIWRTVMLSDFKNFAIQMTKYYVNQFQERWSYVKNYLDDEVHSKSIRLTSAIRSFAEPITEQMQIEAKLLKQDFHTAQEKLNSFFQNNDFYLKDLLRLTDGFSKEILNFVADVLVNVYSSWSQFWNEMEVLIDDLYDIWWSWREKLSDTVDDWTYTAGPYIERQFVMVEKQIVSWKIQLSGGISAIFKTVVNTIMNIVDQSSFFGESIARKFSSLWKTIGYYGKKISSMWSDIKNFFIANWNYVKTGFLQSELYLQSRQNLIQIYSFILHLWNVEIYQEIKTRLDAVHEIVSNHSLISFISRQILWLWDRATYYLNLIIHDPHVQMLRSAITQTHQKIRWILDYYNLRDGLWTSIWRVYQTYSSLVQRRGYEQGVKFDTQNRVVFKPDEGKVLVDQHLPVPWYTLKQLPRFNQLKEIQTLAQLRSWVSGPRTSMWEIYYKYRPYMSPKTWLPPFPTYSIIAGKNHFFTFDGLHYEFSGDCVYLLAQDFVDGNLTLAVNYASKSSGPSLLLQVDGKEVEISSKITINGKKTELPQMIGKTSISRQGGIVTVHPSRGTLVQCNLKYGVCSLWTDGWYFGKIGGMFGIYNNEPVDDVESAITQVEKWEVGVNTCKNSVQFDTPKITTDDCVSFFEDEFSFFKYCFSHVDPKPYQKACEGEIYEGLGICKASAAYVMACELKDIPLSMPRECVRCFSFDGTEVFEGDNVTVRTGDVSPTSDIVFIIEARECNRQSIEKLPDLVRSIDEALTQRNLFGNRYSLVAFGGDDVYDRAHVRTVDNEIFSNERVVVSSFSNIQLGNGTEDVFGALQFASNLPFRIGASKTFVVLVCAPCRQTSKEMDYPEVHRMLLEDRIHIHLIIDHEFNIKGSKDFYGIDDTHAFTVKDSRSKILVGDRELRVQVSPPKYICVPLALESNGTVFSNRALTDGRKRTKSFLDVFSRRVAATASEEIDCLSCDCIADVGGNGKMHCQPCHLPGSWYSELHSFLYDDSMELEELDTSKQKTKE